MAHHRRSKLVAKLQTYYRVWPVRVTIRTVRQDTHPPLGT